jgi:aspartate/methionine/tyrosine aminotransferase
MTFVPFDLERWQSTWEKRVRFNLAESGVHAFSVAEFLDITGTAATELLDIRLGYNQSDGSPALRRAIARLYPGTSDEQITVTVGSAEANFVLCWALIEPGDHVVVISPTYMQIPGLARNFGASVTAVPLRPEADWRLDPADLDRAVRPGTKLIVVTNPNNPTGRILSPPERDAIVASADAVGAWLLADEVYQGAERESGETASFWGAGDRVFVVNGLSKAYGLPGLRIGWIVSSAEFKHDILLRHDYTVIGPTPPSDRLAILALRHRGAVLSRTRGIIRSNYPMLAQWLGGFGDRMTWEAPDSGAITLARYRAGPDSVSLVQRVRATCDVLLAPGAHFGTEDAIRFGFGNAGAELEAALARLEPTLQELLT